MDLYRIRDWNLHFENNRTRELKSLDWVPIPNSMDGDGYTELVDHLDGAAHFGAWVSLLEVASKCFPRGTLIRKSRTRLRDRAEVSRTPLRDGADACESTQKPHNFTSLSRMTRLSEKVFQDAIPRLIDIGWIEVLSVTDDEVTKMSQETDVENGTIPHPPAEKRLWKGREGKGIEGKGSNTVATISGNGKTGQPIEFPPVLNTERFRSIWKDWEDYHTEAKIKFATMTKRKQLKSLAQTGEAEAVARIEQSIENGWKGLFPIKDDHGGSRVDDSLAAAHAELDKIQPSPHALRMDEEKRRQDRADHGIDEAEWQASDNERRKVMKAEALARKASLNGKV